MQSFGMPHIDSKILAQDSRDSHSLAFSDHISDPRNDFPKPI